MDKGSVKVQDLGIYREASRNLASGIAALFRNSYDAEQWLMRFNKDFYDAANLYFTKGGGVDA